MKINYYEDGLGFWGRRLEDIKNIFVFTWSIIFFIILFLFAIKLTLILLGVEL